MLLILLVILALPFSSAQAATFWAAPSDSGSGNCSDASNRCDLQQALNAAGDGDVVSLCATCGNYTGRYDINNDGTATTPILITCESKYNCEFRGDNSTDSNDIAFDINNDGIVIEGVDVRNYYKAVDMRFVGGQTHLVLLRDNIFHNFVERAIDVEQFSAPVQIVRNTISFLRGAFVGRDPEALVHIFDQNNVLVQDNIMWGATTLGKESDFEQWGYGVFIRGDSANNTVQGNVIMALTKLHIRALDWVGEHVQHNVFRDNMAMWSGKHGGIHVGDYVCNDHVVENNIVWGQSRMSGTKGCALSGGGRNVFNHNTFILTDESRGGLEFVEWEGRASASSEFRNNLLYQQFSSSPGIWTYVTHNFNQSFNTSQSGCNLHWKDESNTSNWIANWGGTRYFTNSDLCADIANQSLEPQFTNFSVGDVSLAPGSPGKNAASDGKDIGIEFNAHLKKDWMAKLLALPVGEATVNGKTLNQNVTNGFYLVGVRIGTNRPNIVETLTIEGISANRDLGWFDFDSQDWGVRRYAEPFHRWHFGGLREVTDGQLNVSWNQNASFDGVRWRWMPPPEEMVTWFGTGDTTPPTIPQNLACTRTSDTQVSCTWDASTDDSAVALYQLERCTGQGCTLFAEIALPTSTTFVDAVNIQPTDWMRYRVAAVDTSSNVSGWSNIDDAPPVGAGCVGRTVDAGGGQDHTTIQDAVNAASDNETICVFPGQYNEQVSITKPLTIQANDQNDMPIVDCQATRDHGFTAINLRPVIIDGMHIRNCLQSGIEAVGPDTDNWVIRNSVIHHTREGGIWMEGSDSLIEKNSIWMVSPGDSYCVYAIGQRHTIRLNDLFACGTGVRVKMVQGTVDSNRVYFLQGEAISVNGSIDVASGSTILNNYLGFAKGAMNPQHTLSAFGLTLFAHNSVYSTYWTGLKLNGSPATDAVVGANNVFSNVGGTFYSETNALAASSEGNLYHKVGMRPVLYYSGQQGDESTLAGCEAGTTFCTNSSDGDPQYLNPNAMDLTPINPLISPVNPGTSYGTQQGATGLFALPTTPTFAPIFLTLASCNKTNCDRGVDRVVTNGFEGSWQPSLNPDPQVVYDAGADVVATHLILYNGIDSNVNPNNFQISRGPTASGPWTLLLASSQARATEGTVHELGTNATAARFYQLIFTSNHGGGNYRIDEIALASIGQTVAVPPPGPPTNVNAIPQSSNAIQLTWTAPSSPVGIRDYSIQRCSGAGCTGFATIGTTQITTFVDTGLLSSTLFRYEVLATDTQGQTSSPSAIAEATTFPDVTVGGYVGGTYKGGTYGR